MNFIRLFAAMAFLMLPNLVLAQETEDSNASQARTQVGGDASEKDRIFEEIVRGLPEDLKGQVDSAAAEKASIAEQKRVKELSQSSGGDAAVPNQAQVNDALKDLPEDVRLRVEKAIKEMGEDNRNKEAEFREHRKGKQ